MGQERQSPVPFSCPKKDCKGKDWRMFTLEEKVAIAELRGENKSYKEIAEVLDSTINKVKSYCHTNNLAGFRADNSAKGNEDSFKERFETKHNAFQYVSGYSGRNNSFLCRCKVCGHIQTRNAGCARYSCKSNLTCDNCIRIEKAKLIELKRGKTRKKNEYAETSCSVCGALFVRKGNGQKFCSKECADEAHGINQEKEKACKECGELFKTKKHREIFCSDECRKTSRRKIHKVSRDKRLRKNGKPDNSITLELVIKMESNICHICGKECDKADCRITKEGYFIAGNKYPSTDHVLPIAKGGKHEWNNVKLAHRRCNSIKGDKTTYQGELGQFTLAM